VKGSGKEGEEEEEEKDGEDAEDTSFVNNAFVDKITTVSVQTNLFKSSDEDDYEKAEEDCKLVH
jgi:hypothetical protein